jgi:hypothetical protein
MCGITGFWTDESIGLALGHRRLSILEREVCTTAYFSKGRILTNFFELTFFIRAAVSATRKLIGL